MILPGKPIAIGFNAQVFAWKDGLVLKLFRPDFSRSGVVLEASLARTVHATGLPVPAVGEIIEMDGRYGLEYERVDGISMLQALAQRQWRLFDYARQLAKLHADMHHCQVPGLPAQKERYELKIKRADPLPEDLRQAALNALQWLPDDDRLCHGDFHPGNILETSRGPVIIDWIDASSGSPLMDVARSSLLFGGGRMPPGVKAGWLIGMMQGWFYRAYLKRYFQLNPGDPGRLSSMIPIAAAARLDENIHFDEARLLSIADRLIHAG